MTLMRIHTAFFALLVILTPVIAAADFVPMGPSSLCPKGSGGDPSSPPKVFSFSASATEVRSYLNRRILCASACFDEAVTLNVASTGITVTVAAQNKCVKNTLDLKGEDATKNNRGCAKGQTNPRVAVKITGLAERVIPPKSRCDTSNLSGVINSLAEQKLNDALSRLNALSSPRVGEAAIAPVNIESTAGQKVLAEQLAIAFQITPEEAEAIVQKDPEAALRAIYAVAQGDAGAVKAKAEALGLNPNLADRVALNAKLIQDGNLTEPDDSGAPGTGESTFQKPGILQQLAMNPMPVSPNGRVDPVAFYAHAVQAARNAGLDGYAPQRLVDLGFLKTGSAEEWGRFYTMIAKQESDFNINSSAPSECSYGILQFCPGQYGLRSMQDVRNPESALQAIVKVTQQGKLFQYFGSLQRPNETAQHASWFDRVIAPQVNGEVPYMPIKNVAENSYNDRSSAYSSPFSSITGAESRRPMSYGSPFAQASPAASAQNSYTPAQATQPSQTVSQNVTPSQSQSESSTQSGVAKQLQNALQDPALAGVAGQFPANVVVQLAEVVRGNPVTVSWTSIGMSTETPCVLRAGTTVIAEKNKGSSVVPTTQATRLGSLIFTLSCTTASGTKYQRTAAVMVR